MMLVSRPGKAAYAPAVIDRPRLYQRLERCQVVRAVLIHAPAGYGKSSLVSRWLDVGRYTPHAAWVTLDDRDNNPRPFVRHLAAALDPLFPGALAAVEPILHDTHSSAEQALRSLWAAPRAAAGPALLVLDDLHCIHAPTPEAPGVQALIMACLEQGPPDLHFILLARHRPELPLARLYAAGSLEVLSAADLGFTQDEVHTYLLAQGFAEPSPADLAQFSARSEGWVAALHLAALALRKHRDLHALLAMLHGTQTWVADFLSDEVLNQQTPELRRFLLQTSLLDAFNAELCAAVTGMDDAYARLAEIARADLFLIALDSAVWFRYHPLFQELLQHRLQVQAPAPAVADLHRRAARWLDNAGHMPAAVHHLLAAGDDDAAAALVERAFRPALVRDVYQAQALLALLPPALVKQRPRLMLDRGLLAAALDDPSTLAYADEAAATIGAYCTAPQEVGPQLQAELLVLRATGHFLQRDLEAAARTVHQAQALVGELDDLFCGMLHFLNVHLYRYRGDAHASLAAAGAALAAFTRAGFDVPIVAVRREVARWRMIDGSAEATRLFVQLFDEWGPKSMGVARDLFYAYCYGAENSYWQNQLDQAQAYQQAALHLAHALQDPALLQAASWLGALVSGMPALPASALPAGDLLVPTSVAAGLSLTYQVRALVAAGQPHAAWQALTTAGISLPALQATGEQRRLAAYLLAYIARGVDLEAVTPALTRALDQASRLDHRLHLLQMLALAAWQQLQLGGPAVAAPALAQVATLAAATGYVRVLLDIPALVPLLADHAAQPPPASSACYPPPLAARSTVALTPQEQAVLRLLAADCTYTQIAGELTISVNTVRSHVTNIYRKLGVHRRERAVAVAQVRGCLPG